MAIVPPKPLCRRAMAVCAPPWPLPTIRTSKLRLSTLDRSKWQGGGRRPPTHRCPVLPIAQYVITDAACDRGFVALGAQQSGATAPALVRLKTPAGADG